MNTCTHPHGLTRYRCTTPGCGLYFLYCPDCMTPLLLCSDCTDDYHTAQCQDRRNRPHYNNPTRTHRAPTPKPKLKMQIEQRRAYQRAYYHKNRERMREQQRTLYHRKHPNAPRIPSRAPKSRTNML